MPKNWFCDTSQVFSSSRFYIAIYFTFLVLIWTHVLTIVSKHRKKTNRLVESVSQLASNVRIPKCIINFANIFCELSCLLMFVLSLPVLFHFIFPCFEIKKISWTLPDLLLIFEQVVGTTLSASSLEHVDEMRNRNRRAILSTLLNWNAHWKESSEIRVEKSAICCYLQNDARPHITARVMATTWQLKWRVLRHSPIVYTSLTRQCWKVI